LSKYTGAKKAFKLADHRVSRFGFRHIDHLVENKAEAQLHSGRMVNRLLCMVQQAGVTVMNQVDVKKVDKDSGAVVIESNLPVPLRTKQLLICTNAFSPELIPGVEVVPARGQVLLTSPISKLPFRGTFHYEEGFYYFRDLGDRVLLGGARNKAFKEEETTAFSVSDTIQQELERFLKDVVLPGQSYTIEHRWSGIMGMGKKKLPVIKKLEPGIYCATGLGGMGVTLSPIVGEKVAKMMGV
jgi:gamma-glutamylputrescine oxidase